MLKTYAGQDNQKDKLAHSRAYSLALAPQLLYTRSALLSALVSSQTHSQLEFQAVGSWFVVSSSADNGVEITRVPGGREDVFQDSTLDLKAKRNLMKFLRFVANSEEQRDSWAGDEKRVFSSFLSEKFGLPESSHAPIIALTLSREPLQHSTVANAIPRIAQHLGSIGLFGPGFGAVVPKWGGLAEIGQVACRACAVGGGVYVLGKGIDEVHVENDSSVSVHLSGGEKVVATWLVGDDENLPTPPPSIEGAYQCFVSESISIISSPLSTLFPATSEGGPIPAGAVVLVPSSDDSKPPVHILAHSSESGECPAGQSTYNLSFLPQITTACQRNDERLLRILIYIV
jgi:RAB protein geranylgeranyltransferase component A